MKLCNCCGVLSPIEEFRSDLCFDCAGLNGYKWEKGYKMNIEFELTDTVVSISKNAYGELHLDLNTNKEDLLTIVDTINIQLTIDELIQVLDEDQIAEIHDYYKDKQ